MKQTRGKNLAIMAAGLLCAGLIFGTDVSAAGVNACAEDIAKFCQNIAPGRAALIQCLEKHENELSAACKAQEAKMDTRRAEGMELARQMARLRQDCRNDMARFCADAGPAHGGMIKCLTDHQQDISAACSESIKLVVE